jgi:hypothetical protein
VVDPAEEFNSAYLYAANKPAIVVDPDGMRIFLSPALVSQNEFMFWANSSPLWATIVGLFGKGGPLEHIDLYFDDKSFGSRGTTDLLENGKIVELNQDLKLRERGARYHDINPESDYGVYVVFNHDKIRAYGDDAGNGQNTYEHEITHLLVYVWYFLRAKLGEGVERMPIGEVHDRKPGLVPHPGLLNGILDDLIIERGYAPVVHEHKPPFHPGLSGITDIVDMVGF